MQKRITIAPQSPLVTQSQSKGKGCSAKGGRTPEVEEITLGALHPPPRHDNRFADDLIFAHRAHRETLCNQVDMLPTEMLRFPRIFHPFIWRHFWGFHICGRAPSPFVLESFLEAIYVIASILKCRFWGIESLFPWCRVVGIEKDHKYLCSILLHRCLLLYTTVFENHSKSPILQILLRFKILSEKVSRWIQILFLKSI